MVDRNKCSDTENFAVEQSKYVHIYVFNCRNLVTIVFNKSIL